ncbi:ATP-binding protein [Streptomyces sp. NPDC057966]|uniref:ATP-binding protein n=1 Tax=Streptomyces sp. NPDC057966 TaxID=3346292 RepID=UPI0036DFDF98
MSAMPLTYPPAPARASVVRAPYTVAGARRAARGLLHAWSVDTDRTDDALLIVSELVTNAFRHGRSPITLALRHCGGLLTVAVRDAGGYQLWTQTDRRSAPPDETGRGLDIVAALATRCGARTTATHTTVWARL